MQGLASLVVLLVVTLFYPVVGLAGQVSFKGEWRQGAIVFGHAPVGTEIILDGQGVMSDKEGYFVLGFDRDASPRSVLELTYPDGRRETRELQVSEREYQKQYINGVEKKYVSPSPEQVKRSREDALKVKSARARRFSVSHFRESFQWPLLGPITGVFGSQRVYNGEPRRPHYGVDVAAPVGTEVVAPAGGVVTLAEPDLYFSGGTLILDHGHGLSSSFLHLHRLLVKEGDWVVKGQPIAQVGATGRVTGAHLDWRMNWHDRRVDPTVLVPTMQTVLKKEKTDD